MADPLDALSESPEAKITRAFFAVLVADTTLSAIFTPILLIESPTREAFDALTPMTLALIPLRIRAKDMASDRQTIILDLVISAYLPREATEENSKLRLLDLGNHIRKLTYTNLGLGGLTFQTADFVYLPALEPKNTAIRIVSFQITFQADIVTTTSAFA